MFACSMFGIIDPADCLTKPVAWILHHCHARRLMGHCGPDFPVSTSLPSLIFPFLGSLSFAFS
jgi:hypothetical protein